MFQCDVCGLAGCTCSSRGNEDAVADDIDEFDVAAVLLQGWPDLAIDGLLDHLDLLDVGELRSGDGCGLGPHPLDDLPDRVMTSPAAAAGFGVVRHLFDGGEIVFPHGLLDVAFR